MLVVMSAKKNTVVTLSILAACLVFGYIYAVLLHNAESAAPLQPAESLQQAAAINPNTITVTQTTAQDYFEEYRLERDRLRSKQVELLREIVNNTNSSAENRSEAQKKLLAIVDKIDLEVQVEKVLVARGFKDAVVFIRPDNITVVIRSYSLIQQDADKVKEIVSQLAGVSNEEIIVLSKK